MLYEKKIGTTSAAVLAATATAAAKGRHKKERKKRNERKNLEKVVNLAAATRTHAATKLPLLPNSQFPDEWRSGWLESLRLFHEEKYSSI